MVRTLYALLLTLAVGGSISFAQDRATRQANKTIRAQEKEVLNRVTQRVEWDKQLTGSTLHVEVKPGGAVVLKGSVMSEAARARAVDLVESTTGVETVTDQLAVVKNGKVIQAKSAARAADASDPASGPSESRIITQP